MADTSIKGLIQSMVSVDGESIMQGTVISVSPLKIQMENDSKHIITERITIVPWHLTDYKTSITLKDDFSEWVTQEKSGGSGYALFESHTHDIVGPKRIRVLNHLRLGEKLHILSLNKGKLYYVLDRVNDPPEG